jgi:hypothetical protein
MGVITRSTVPTDNIVRLADWQPRYASIKREDPGLPVTEIRSPARVLALTEAAIESSLRDYAKAHGLTGAERAASIACALRWFRGGSSAAKAIGEGMKRARALAWGNGPEASA